MPRSSLRFARAAVLLFAVGSVALSGCKSSTGVQGASGVPAVTGTAPVTVTSTGSGDYTVDFGNVAVGQHESTTLVFANTGTSPLQILSVGAPSDPEFTNDLTVGTNVQPGQSVNVQLDLKPFNVGAKSATIAIVTDSLTVTNVNLTLIGNGVALKLGVDPQTVDFGSVVVHTSVSKIVTLSNTSELDLTITPSPVQGNAASLYTVNQTDVFTLKAGDTAQLQVTYSPVIPSMPSADTAYFTLSLSTGSPVTVSLQGNGVQSGLQVSPNPLDFGFVQPGQQLTLALHIVNVGNQQVNVASIAVTTSVNAFALSTGAPQTAMLQGGQSIDVNVTFSPIASQHYDGELQIVSNDNLGLQTIPLKGYGGGAAITCNPITLDFGLAPANFTTTLPVICTNTGTDILVSGQPDPNAKLNITGFRVEGGNGAFQASIDPASPQGALAAGQSVQVDVTFTPGGTESDTATITVQSNVTNPPAPQTVKPPVLNVSGQGILEDKCYYSLTPTSLNWGQVKPGSTVYTQAFTITNTGPNECLVNGVNVLPTSDGVFTMTQIVSQRLSPPGPTAQFPTSLVVPVNFEPQQAGNYAGTVGFSISDPDGPNVRVPLAGTGGNSCFLVKPSDLNFGVVGLSNGQYCAKGKKTFVGVNGCTTPVTITGVTLADTTSASPFTFVSPPGTPVTVAAGQSSAPFQVGFKPTASGSYFGSAQVQTDLQQTAFGIFFKGTAAVGSTQTDHFIGQTPKADIVWVMDTDDDDTERANVAAKAGEFVNALIADGLDFQIAVTSTDTCGTDPTGTSENGRLLPCPGCKITGSTPTIITADDSNAGPDLETLMTINQRVSNTCRNDEQFFATGYQGFVSGAGATYNTLNSFVRSDAYLALITVNNDDEDDNSRNNTPDYYAGQFLSIKGTDHPELFSWSYINPSQYGAPGGHQPFNRLPQRIASMLTLVGGVALDTTQPEWWKGILDLWQIVLASNVRFPLSGSPVTSTIQVYLDGPPPDQVGPGQEPGVLIQPTNPNQSWNWEYNSTSNSIEVNPLTLKLGASDILYVTYTLGC